MQGERAGATLCLIHNQYQKIICRFLDAMGHMRRMTILVEQPELGEFRRVRVARYPSMRLWYHDRCLKSF